jgi:NAD(P)H-dependent flavin oxidoreductase YrpB (nitropropane dioxygenase family)
VWRDRRIIELFGIVHPILQAPMAGAQMSEMAIAVTRAGGLGALPCALLSHEQAEAESGNIEAAISALKAALSCEPTRQEAAYLTDKIAALEILRGTRS